MDAYKEEGDVGRAYALYNHIVCICGRHVYAYMGRDGPSGTYTVCIGKGVETEILWVRALWTSLCPTLNR